MARMSKYAMLSLVLALSSGCGTMVKRTVGEVKGAGSDATSVPGSGGESYARFQAVEIQTPQSELGGLLPAEFKTMLATDLRKELTQGKEPVFTGGSPAVTIEPHIMWYNKSNAMMPNKYVVVLYYIRGEGAELGRVQVVTKSGATGTGPDDLADSSAKEMAKYFRKHGRTSK